MSNQKIPTPIGLVKEIERHFNIKFKYDMAASEDNHKAPVYYTESDDSLSMNWPTDGWCFLNPPFANLGAWVKKCSEQSSRGSKIVSIWPLSGDINQISTWKESSVNIIHGRVWSEVRGVMVCVWNNMYKNNNQVNNLRWDKKKLTII